MLQRNILVSVAEEFAGLVEEEDLRRWADRALEAEGVASPLELSIAVVDDQVIRSLNREYRGLDEATDVLSFSWISQDPRQEREPIPFPSPHGAANALGEVVIAYDYAAAQARAEGRCIGRELAHLLVHGILHILGYDHEAEDEARAMRGREEAILGWRV